MRICFHSMTTFTKGYEVVISLVKLLGGLTSTANTNVDDMSQINPIIPTRFLGHE